MKHAYLIIAHGSIPLLKQLIALVDDKRNDIFIHVDAKLNVLPDLRSRYSKLEFTPIRIDVRWGDKSLVEVELLLFETAQAAGPYKYYHLLSGADLPVKSQDYIHDTCDKLAGKEFVGFVKESVSDLARVNKFHLFTKHYKSNNIFEKIFWKTLRAICETVVNVVVPKRKFEQEFKKGCNWVSITEDFCKYLVTRKNDILHIYRYSQYCDEVFLQTELWNSPFRTKIYDLKDEYHSCLREIDWMRGNPYVWKTKEDFEYLIKSESFFARKFSLDYPEIITSISNKLK